MTIENSNSYSNIPLYNQANPSKRFKANNSIPPSQSLSNPNTNLYHSQYKGIHSVPSDLWKKYIFPFLGVMSLNLARVNKTLHQAVLRDPFLSLQIFFTKPMQDLEISTRLGKIMLPNEALQKVLFERLNHHFFSRYLSKPEPLNQLFAYYHQNKMTLSKSSLTVLKGLGLNKEIFHLHYLRLNPQSQKKFTITDLEALHSKLSLKKRLTADPNAQLPDDLKANRDFILFAATRFDVSFYDYESRFTDFLKTMDSSLNHEEFWLSLIERNHLVYNTVPEDFKKRATFNTQAYYENKSIQDVDDFIKRLSFDNIEIILDILERKFCSFYIDLFAKIKDVKPQSAYYNKSKTLALKYLVRYRRKEFISAIFSSHFIIAPEIAIEVIRVFPSYINTGAGFRKTHQTALALLKEYPDLIINMDCNTLDNENFKNELLKFYKPSYPYSNYYFKRKEILINNLNQAIKNLGSASPQTLPFSLAIKFGSINFHQLNNEKEHFRQLALFFVKVFGQVGAFEALNPTIKTDDIFLNKLCEIYLPNNNVNAPSQG